LRLLNPNHREHWADRKRRFDSLKKATWAMALKHHVPHLGKARIHVEYQPPSRRHYDPDNAPAASAKPCIDGLVAAHVLPGDDSRYVTAVTATIGEPHPKGRLVLTITDETGVQ